MEGRLGKGHWRRSRCSDDLLEPVRYSRMGKALITAEDLMISLELDSSNEQRLQALANRQGQDVSQVAARIIESYLDANAWDRDTDQQWAEASTALAREVFADVEWPEGESADGSG